MTFCSTFKVKYPVNGAKSMFNFHQTDECESGNIQNIGWCTYHGSLEMSGEGH